MTSSKIRRIRRSQVPGLCEDAARTMFSAEVGSMRGMCRSMAVGFLAVLGTVVLAIGAIVAPGMSVAATTALVLGGTGTPSPAAEPGYMENVTRYYINRYSSCGCDPTSFTTPETAWPLYGGLSALTWQDSVLTGSSLLDQAIIGTYKPADGDPLVLFGYSQSGAILALQKRKILEHPEIYGRAQNYEIVVIGNVSRPNGGLNSRLPITVPIVEFPYGPPMTPGPAVGGVKTTDIALKWDIIADAPLYATNPLAMANALLGGPGFGIVHGTYPNPEGTPPSGLIGGYTQEEWETILANPELNAHLIEEETVGDTTYITITPKVLPLVAPLHQIGLTPVADLIEPALRVIIEETGYDRDASYGTPTTFRLIPIFNPVKLGLDLVPAVTEGVDQFAKDLQGQQKPSPVVYPDQVAGTTERAATVAEPAPTTPVAVDAPATTKKDKAVLIPVAEQHEKDADKPAVRPRAGADPVKSLFAKPKKILNRIGSEVNKAIRGAQSSPAQDAESTPAGEDAVTKDAA
jgi:hypothetical protein